MRGIANPAVLIVENEEDTRRLYADVLSSLHACILEAGNPYEAFDLLRTYPVTVIITDLCMPGGGLDYLMNLRQRQRTCPIIAITGWAEEAIRQKAILAGATEFLEKPIRSKQLREVVAHFLSIPPTPI